MRWRILPGLNLERVAETKALLLGAGTLGCFVSRALLVGVVTILQDCQGLARFLHSWLESTRRPGVCERSPF